MAFGTIVLIDLVVLLFLLICIFLGLYGHSEGGHGEEEDEVAKDTGYMDDKAFGGEEIPCNKELEHIPEMSQEDFETSRGSYAELRPLKLSLSPTRESFKGGDRESYSRKPSRIRASRVSRHKPSIDNMVFE